MVNLELDRPGQSKAMWFMHYEFGARVDEPIRNDLHEHIKKREKKKVIARRRRPGLSTLIFRVKEKNKEKGDAT